MVDRTRLSEELYPFESHWLELGDSKGESVRYHYLDEGPRDGRVVVMLHGNPTWSFYYRTLIPALSQGYRVVVPDHVLFIGLLAAFEATAGVLAISGGRRTQLGYLAVIAFYLALWPFGWIEAVWVLVMLPDYYLDIFE